jgi:ketosteroid isomerase-like protein
MRKSAALLVLGLMLAALSHGQDEAPPNPEMEREEIVNLEKEAARAIQWNDATFFRRVYSDDFAGTLSHGQPVDRNQWIKTIQSTDVKYESFTASDIKVRIFKEFAVATCLWSVRSIIRGQRVNSQIRAMHIYINTPRGWHVIAGQTTNLPPDVQQPL